MGTVECIVYKKIEGQTNKQTDKQTNQYEFLKKKNVSGRTGEYQMDLPPPATSNIFTSWNFPNLKTFIQNEQTVGGCLQNAN